MKKIIIFLALVLGPFSAPPVFAQQTFSILSELGLFSAVSNGGFTVPLVCEGEDPCGDTVRYTELRFDPALSNGHFDFRATVTIIRGQSRVTARNCVFRGILLPLDAENPKNSAFSYTMSNHGPISIQDTTGSFVGVRNLNYRGFLDIDLNGPRLISSRVSTYILTK